MLVKTAVHILMDVRRREVDQLFCCVVDGTLLRPKVLPEIQYCSRHWALRSTLSAPDICTVIETSLESLPYTIKIFL
jgi:hypothetical protein